MAEDPVPKIILPKEKTPPVRDLSRQRILIYGPPKIGKSTWCSRAPGAIFLDCENGLQNLEAHKVLCRNWAELKGAVVAIRAGGHNFKTVVVDTLGAAYTMVQNAVINKNNAEWINDNRSLGYGKGRSLSNRGISWLLNQLGDPRLNLGLYLIAHEKTETVKNRFGDEVIRTGPDLHETIAQEIAGWADMILRCGYESVEVEGQPPQIERQMIAEGTEYLVAGDRTGMLPKTMPLSFPHFEKAYLAALNGKPKSRKEDK